MENVRVSQAHSDRAPGSEGIGLARSDTQGKREVSFKAGDLLLGRVWAHNLVGKRRGLAC
ncbi:hypothetical protein D3C77_773280 [compost metagenome]